MAHACFFEISPPLSPTLSHSFVVGEGEKSGAVSRCAPSKPQDDLRASAAACHYFLIPSMAACLATARIVAWRSAARPGNFLGDWRLPNNFKARRAFRWTGVRSLSVFVNEAMGHITTR
jgi:hypothetical protein